MAPQTDVRPWHLNRHFQPKDNAPVEIGGFFWPKGEERTANIIFRESKRIPDYLSHVRGNDLCIQAGANVGVYPSMLAKHFKNVMTFEPDSLIFQMLDRNITDQNVIYRHAALGETWGTCGVTRAENCGAGYINFEGQIPVIAVDDLNLECCDFIWLDIEGYELHALKGAEDTIRRFKPTIAVEDKGLQTRYGVEMGDIQRWLEQYGYKQVGRIKRDSILCAT